jgi:hypothetical protein
MTKRDRLLELATELVTARARVTELEAQIDELFGDDGATRPGRRPTRRKEARGGSDGAGGAALPPTTNGASNGHGPGRGHYQRQFSAETVKVEALARDGMAPVEIAAKLGWKGRAGNLKVSNVIYRARRAGRLPKAEASR